MCHEMFHEMLHEMFHEMFHDDRPGKKNHLEKGTRAKDYPEEARANVGPKKTAKKRTPTTF